MNNVSDCIDLSNAHRVDDLYANKRASLEPFQFNDSVACVFSDMIKRSVPGYEIILSSLASLTEHFSQVDSNYYDLGCSLGAVSLVMSKYINQAGGQVIAVDNSLAMLERCQQLIQAYQHSTPVRFLLDDITQIEISNAAIVVLNFTLQFIENSARSVLIERIYHGLKPGGMLLLSEKIHDENKQIEGIMQSLHHEFKRTNGYSELEISQKRMALENVLITDSYQQHVARLKQAGFKHYGKLLQYYNFTSLIAVKD